MTADRAAFDALVAPHRAELHAHCYRMLGSPFDADDALQDALLAAWRAFATFEGRGTLRAWLYKIATNAALAIVARRPRRLLAPDHAPPTEGIELEPPVLEPMWIEPYDDAAAQLAHRESLELAYIAALQVLPGTQRAAVLLRDVLGFSAEETAELLDTSVASITSALQRGRDGLARRVPARSQQVELAMLGDAKQRALAAAFAAAWTRADVPALIAMLAADAKFAMPPIPCWFTGHAAIGRFLRERVFAQPWRCAPIAPANGQLAFLASMGPTFAEGALQVLAVRDGMISDLTGFLDPALRARFTSAPPFGGATRPAFAGLVNSARRPMSLPAPGSLIDMTTTYTGRCHCGAIEFRVDLDLSAGTTRCNCTFCAKSRIWLAFAKPAAFTLVRGADMLADYQHAPAGKEPFLHLHFCRRCGIRPFTKGGYLPAFDGEFYAINVAALELSEEQLAAIPVRYADGKHDAWDRTPAHHAYL